MKRSFTLLEVMVALIIVLILATLAIVGYRQVLDNARQRICGSNQTVITGALERYILETGRTPASLGEIRLEYLRDAYVEVTKKWGLFTRFSHFLLKLNQPKLAFAEIDKLEDLVDWAKMQSYGVPREIFVCPADHTPPPYGVSYGINVNLKNFNKWEDVPEDMPIIGDCESLTFASWDELEARHIRKYGIEKIAQTVTKGGLIKKIGKGKGKP